VKIQVDDLPQVSERESEKTAPLVKLPLDLWGIFDPPGDRDDIEFVAVAGQNLVFDVAAKSLGSKAAVAMELTQFLYLNGLPAFTHYYANDDDGERKLGTDSRLQFAALADGT
jgi:hypothetical protein